MQHLPRDVALRVVAKLDVDARRALGIYAPLRVPSRVAEAVTRALAARAPSGVVTLVVGAAKALVFVPVQAAYYRVHYQAAARRTCVTQYEWHTGRVSDTFELRSM